MAKISTEELSRQLNIQVKKVDALKVNASVIDIADTAKATLKVGVGGLTDQLPNLTNQLKDGIPTDLAATLTDKLPGGLDDLNNLFAGATPQLSELGKLNVLQDFGPAKGGIQSLMKAAEDKIDEAQEQLPQLLKKVEPVLAKVDQSIANEIPELKTAISEADIANMDKIFSSPEGLGADLSTMFEKVTPQLQNAAAVTKEIFTDGSIEAIAEELKEASGKDFTQLKGTLTKFAGDAEGALGEIDDMLNKLKGGDLVGQLTSNLGKLDQVLSGTVDQLTGGGLLKGLAEKVTNNIGSAITSLNLPTGSFNTLAVKNDVLSGNLTAAKDKLAAAVPIPDAAVSALAKAGAPAPVIRTKEDLKAAVRIAEKGATTPEEIAAVESIKASGDAIDAKMNKDLASLNGNVTTTTPETPSNPNPVSNADEPKKFNILSSRQELIKYFQAANRELTCLNVSGSGRLATGATAERFVEYYKNENPSLQYIDDGPGHLFIRGDGTIETMKDINVTEGNAAEAPGGRYVVDIVLAEYRQKNPRPSSKQIEAMMTKVIPAFFSVVPYGEVYPGTLSEGFIPLGGVPFWNVDIKDYFPTKKNVFDPNAEDYYPQPDQLVNRGKEQAENAAREQKDGV